MSPAQMALRAANVISRHGASVTLPDASIVRAVVCTTDKDIQKYVTSDDGTPGGRGKVVIVFVFPGSVFGSLGSGDTLVYNNVRYVVQTPMYPHMNGDVCIEFAVACHAP